ncbi:pyridoxamine 5'-phosphate oxidase family protein [Pseudonocardia sp. TRM90224]|uniref:pyridoxamine 5'-phosphate oxidase family protein n=1 Tax=Pseudonocardia sp. TRM90224 TaxID=2812678 RepID=UPI001E29ED11|nr:pyridoxamine 5'-phosphate oxidase family protein [Pseudonocardia sp. TRM90224]
MTWDEYVEVSTSVDYMVLATADEHGAPWASPVFFRSDDAHDLLWVSSPTSRHSLNIAARPQVAATIFDSTVPVGQAQAVYVAGTAEQLPDSAADTVVATLNRGLPAGKHLDADGLRGAGVIRAYRLVVAERFLLVRGSDPRTTNPVDSRITVPPPA